MKKSRLTALVVFMLGLLFSADIFAIEVDSPIYNPQGETVTYRRDGKKHYPMGQLMINEFYDWYPGDIVFGENNEVYIKNPVIAYPYDTYMKGTISGNKITVKLPQAIELFVNADGSQTMLYVQRMKLNIENDPTYEVDDSKDYVTYTIDGDVYTMENDGNKIALGITDANGRWLGEAETNQVFYPLVSDLVTPPEGLKLEEWAISHYYGEYTVKVGFTEDECYIQGISPTLPESWIKGEMIKTGENERLIRIPTNQYLGINMLRGVFPSITYFIAALKVPDFYDEADYYLEKYDEILLEYDIEKGTMTPEDDMVYVINPGNGIIQYIEYYVDFKLERQGPITVSNPVKPIFLQIRDYDEDDGFGFVYFEWPAVDVNGHVLDTSKLYYEVYANGAPFTFEPSLYRNLEYPITDVAYDFSDNHDFQYDFRYHKFNFYFQNHVTLGLVSKYVDGNVVLRSQMAEFDMNNVGISSVEATPVAVEYYDMQGRKVNNPERGIYIKVCRYADGTAKTFKSVM